MIIQIIFLLIAFTITVNTLATAFSWQARRGRDRLGMHFQNRHEYCYIHCGAFCENAIASVLTVSVNAINKNSI